MTYVIVFRNEPLNESASQPITVRYFTESDAWHMITPIKLYPSLKAGFHFNRIVPKRIVFLCFLSTRVELMFRHKRKYYGTLRYD